MRRRSAIRRGCMKAGEWVNGVVMDREITTSVGSVHAGTVDGEVFVLFGFMMETL